jgi:predicted nucleic acid-binding protein
MGTVLDTTVFIELERAMRGLPAERAMKEVAQRLEAQLGEVEDVGIAAITSSELLHSVHRAAEEHRGRRETFVESILAAFPVIAFDVLVARVHARLWAGLVSSGGEVGAHDRLVAASALSAGWRIATANVAHFNRIPGLDVVPVQLC